MSDSSKKIIASNLRKARIAKQMTQEEVAEKADISTNHYARVERGETSPNLDTFERIIKSIGVKSKDILPY